MEEGKRHRTDVSEKRYIVKVRADCIVWGETKKRKGGGDGGGGKKRGDVGLRKNSTQKHKDTIKNRDFDSARSAPSKA